MTLDVPSNNHSVDDAAIPLVASSAAVPSLLAPSLRQLLPPVNDPAAWLRQPMFRPPADVDIERCQKEIDGIYGVTRDNQSILKLVWSGDREYWRQIYMSWDANGQPNEGIVRRPLLRYRTLNSPQGQFIRDAFPPRWLILTRIEPEQYPNWRNESWMHDGVSQVKKLIRPEDPPPVYWLWFATVARHNGHCCVVNEKDGFRCYGEYAPPQYIYDTIGQQKLSDERLAITRPFEQIDSNDVAHFDDINTGYHWELKKLRIEQELYTEHAEALLGPAAIMAAGISSPQQARDAVREFFDREIDETAEEAERMKGS